MKLVIKDGDFRLYWEIEDQKETNEKSDNILREFREIARNLKSFQLDKFKGNKILISSFPLDIEIQNIKERKQPKDVDEAKDEKFQKVIQRVIVEIEKEKIDYKKIDPNSIPNLEAKPIKKIKNYLTMYFGGFHQVEDQAQKNLSILLTGDYGTGKTTAIKAVAWLWKLKVYKITPSLVISKFLGESAKILRGIFEYIQKESSLHENVAIYFNEYDGITTEGGDEEKASVGAEINSLIDSYRGIIFLDTNYPDKIRKAHRSRMNDVPFELPKEKEKEGLLYNNLNYKLIYAFLEKPVNEYISGRLVPLISKSAYLSFRDLLKIVFELNEYIFYKVYSTPNDSPSKEDDLTKEVEGIIIKIQINKKTEEQLKKEREKKEEKLKEKIRIGTRKIIDERDKNLKFAQTKQKRKVKREFKKIEKKVPANRRRK